MSRRQRVQRAKAGLLADLSEVVNSWDETYFETTADAEGVTETDVEAAADELASQLYAWALRIGPKVPRAKRVTGA